MALTGTSSYMDVLFLAIHFPQEASETNQNEFPISSMTGTFCFLIENSAIVSYMQSIGRAGHLVTVRVSPDPIHNTKLSLTYRRIQSFFVMGIPATMLYLLGPTLTVIAAVFLGVIQEWWGLGVLALLLLSRGINMVIVSRRSTRRKVIREPGVEGDRIIFMSRNRWIRLRGMVDDLRTVTTCQFLRDESTLEGLAVSFAKLLVCLAAALAGNISTVGSLMIVSHLLCSSALLASSKFFSPCLQIFDCVVRVEGEPTRYERRMSDMIAEVIKETRSTGTDWAIGMELIVRGTV
ncbi:hypothetical protein EV421DRAFT_1799164 [Armillaria borealis]|uniref:Uncharacterized protein n=1 Tax=Armillaria borealis TaxID=47425 RepID=A0AA39JL20_9AGAR|nr:hypothetical protein EV421DRAFT_1799164 [Armillaria borealis]